MIRKIILENYMAHVRTVIEPAEGLTVLIGPNNCGKSAIIHALEMICYNSDAADFAIRHGTSKATVTIETEDANGKTHTLVWWRKKNCAGYIVDGREISKLGKAGVPDDLHEHLMMPMVEPSATEKAFSLHFGLQKSPIFLVNEPPGRIAQFFGSSTDADKLLEMQTVHKQKALRARQEKEKLDAELVKLDAQLGVLSPLVRLGEELTTLEREHARLTASATAMAVLARCLGTLDRAIRAVEIGSVRVQSLAPLRPPPARHDLGRLKSIVQMMAAANGLMRLSGAVRAALAGLNPVDPPRDTRRLAQLCLDMAAANRRHQLTTARNRILHPLQRAPVPRETAPLRQRIAQVEEAHRLHARSNARSQALEDLAPPPPRQDVTPLVRTIRAMETLEAQTHCHQSRADALAELPAPPTLADPKSLQAMVTAIAGAERRLRAVASEQSALVPLQTPPAPADTAPLGATILHLQQAASLVTTRRTALLSGEKNLAELHREIEQWVRDNPRCRVCGQELQADLIVGGGHTHE